MNNIRYGYLVAVLVLFLSACTSLDKHPVYVEKGVAINGYDPVAYFAENAPVKGSELFKVEHEQVIWLFSSAENLAQFEYQPERYLPQYGGYCAYAMSHGFVVDTVPEAFTVLNDKLYLNYSLGVRETWLEDTKSYVDRADKQWDKKLTK
ncbi:tat pathway signal sequence domain protein [Shewanella sp. D64]|uniref:YHS domain-containing (seleno)protein n=1 Tax=unclassified Shewanella TaxID=196818 RepID=UPI0022BA5FAC|nr:MULTISPECIES: YHS domain-containing (seleno)protein [unclassified Shewanella]MEC4725987.1 tat pathway signal sequence domain protein [Shewanella sp. D64]MEC4737242.1 tat pathway signal sequence domain protein [Shewanella sp. E94]WBJ93621.1 tat pathway signal sequence domain protein [Shewanella sp. MTB7]